MAEKSNPPIVDHLFEQPSAFTAAQLTRDFRSIRSVPAAVVPPVCVLEFDGDLTAFVPLQWRLEPGAMSSAGSSFANTPLSVCIHYSGNPTSGVMDFVLHSPVPKAQRNSSSSSHMQVGWVWVAFRSCQQSSRTD